jgi:hypothetical protein
MACHLIKGILDAKVQCFWEYFVACPHHTVTYNEMTSEQQELKERKRSSNQSELSLVDLPDAVLALVARCSRPTRGHPLLQLSRVARDAVLSCSKTVSLHLAGDEHAPEARLLDRACFTASVGLELVLDLHGRHSEVLFSLLKRGVTTGGWPHVQNLEVGASIGGSMAVLTGWRIHTFCG